MYIILSAGGAFKARNADLWTQFICSFCSALHFFVRNSFTKGRLKFHDCFCFKDFSKQIWRLISSSSQLSREWTFGFGEKDIEGISKHFMLSLIKTLPGLLTNIFSECHARSCRIYTINRIRSWFWYVMAINLKICYLSRFTHLFCDLCLHDRIFYDRIIFKECFIQYIYM